MLLSLATSLEFSSSNRTKVSCQNLIHLAAERGRGRSHHGQEREGPEVPQHHLRPHGGSGRPGRVPEGLQGAQRQPPPHRVQVQRESPGLRVHGRGQCTDIVDDNL